MKKSVYSIVLMDEIVNAVDRIAYSRNTNRSNMINQILAEYCSYVTPEKRISDIFEYAVDLMRREECFQMQATDAVLSIKSALSYKYNPVIRYSVQLFRSADEAIGELKVNFRTQNQSLIDSLTDFYENWTETEKRHSPICKRGIPIICSFDSERLIRRFTAPEQSENTTTQKMAEAITDYVQVFDRALKIWFKYGTDRAEAKKQIEKCYLAYIHSGSVMI